MSNDLVQCSALCFHYSCTLHRYISLDSNNIRFCTYRTQTDTWVFLNARDRERVVEFVFIRLLAVLCVRVFARVSSPKCNCKIDENMALNALLKYLTLTMAWVYHWPFIHSLLNKSFKTFYPKMYQRHCASTLLQMQPNRKRFETTKIKSTKRKRKWKKRIRRKVFSAFSRHFSLSLTLSPSQFLITLCARILYMKISVWYILLVTFAVAATASVAFDSYSALLLLSSPSPLSSFRSPLVVP